LQEKRLIHFQEPDKCKSEDDLFVDLTIHDVSASLLKEFSEKVIRPYYEGGVSEAIKDLIRKAISEYDVKNSEPTVLAT
jgi:hypothetical protein